MEESAMLSACFNLPNHNELISQSYYTKVCLQYLIS